MRMQRTILIALLFVLSITSVSGTDFKKEVIDPSYQHDKYGTQPKDITRVFRAYMTSFDSDDDDDGDGKPDRRGIPEWVAYEMRGITKKLRAGPKRPAPWITDSNLFDLGIAPGDETYQYSKSFRNKHRNWYVRGHLCMKQHAWRLGAAADWNTHTVLNAVPQRDAFNSGIWQDLENMTADWADEYDAVWIITGPVFSNGKPAAWLGEDGEVKIAIPDALFKIVIKESSDPNRPDVLAFIYPQEGSNYRRKPFDHVRYLTSVQRIEKLTGLNFFTALPAADQKAVESTVPTTLWH